MNRFRDAINAVMKHSCPGKMIVQGLDTSCVPAKTTWRCAACGASWSVSHATLLDDDPITLAELQTFKLHCDGDEIDPFLGIS